MAHIGGIVHLLGRYPELRRNSAFMEWISTHSAEVWHEQEEEDLITIVIQSTDGISLFAAQCDKRDEAESPVNIHKVADINLLQIEMLRDNALLEIKRESGIVDPSRFHAIRPIVHFGDNGSAEVAWEIEISPAGEEESRYRVSARGVRRMSADPSSDESDDRASQTFNDWIQPLADDLASNEIHHRIEFASDARAAIGSATTIEGKARGIFDYVRRNYLYDGNIRHISEFTWSDLLVRNANGRRGICDEWAVIQITLLRAVSIPARLKFLIWQQGAEWVGHACLEYRDGNLWWHMVALWNALKYPQVYRNSGARSLTVMDADYPIDSRSTVPAWGVPDVTGDGKLHPYRDFIINPNYPGNSRPGYSY